MYLRGAILVFWGLVGIIGFIYLASQSSFSLCSVMLELTDLTFNQLSLPIPPGVVFARQFRPFTLKLYRTSLFSVF
jgi:hypothetical protein